MPRKYISLTNLTFLILICLAFSLRAVYFNQTIRFLHPASGSDANFYIQWAEDIVRGNVLGKSVFYALPLYPYFLSLCYIFAAGETFALVLFQLLIGSINCGLIYLLGRKLFNNQVGIIAAVIACTYFMFIFYDRLLLPATLIIFLGLVLALYLLKIIGEPPLLSNWFKAGLLLGLCSLTSASFMPLAGFILFWMSLKYRKGFTCGYLLPGLSFILPFFLMLGTVTLRNYLVARDAAFITAHSGINFYIGNNPKANGLFTPPPYIGPTQSSLTKDAQIIAERITAKRLKPSEVSNFWFRRGLNFIKNQPLDYLKLMARKFILFWNGKEYVDDIEYYIFSQEAKPFYFAFFRFSLICPLAIVGMVLSWPRAKPLFLLYAFVVSLMLATLSFFINSRYRLSAVPYLIIFAAAAIVQIVILCRNRQYKKLSFTLILFFACYFLANIKVESVSPKTDFIIHYNKGIYLIDQQEYQKAEQEFSAALKLNPFDYMSNLAIGNIYYQRRDFLKALDFYQRALVINPYFADAHFNLGMVYNEIGKRQDAENAFKKVLELVPDDCATHYNLGRLYQEKGLNNLALQEYQEALKIKPGHWEILQAIKELTQNEKNN